MWKSNWDETRQRFNKWWNRDGLVLGMYGAPETAECIHENVPRPVRPATLEEFYCNAGFRAAQNHFRLSRSVFPLDVLPTATTNLGPGSLALLLGAKPGFSEATVWFHPCIEQELEPEKLEPFRFDPNHPWWHATEDIVSCCAKLARGKYIVGCPDLIENVDVLASLRGAETLLIDLIERPEWVEQKLWEINDVWFAAYDRIYELIKLEDGSSASGPFHIWGPGKVAKLQCDTSAMFSPKMYQRFVVPPLTAQCAWLDHSLYHLDGTQAMPHLDALLAIEPLDAIEWTPQASMETGGHKRWHGLYRRVLAAGKSVQILNVEPDEVVPLLDAIGPKGVYIFVPFMSEREAETLRQSVEHHFGAIDG